MGGGRQTDRQTDRQTETEIEAETERDKDRETETERDRDRQTERQTERRDRQTDSERGETDRQIQNYIFAVSFLLSRPFQHTYPTRQTNRFCFPLSTCVIRTRKELHLIKITF